mmetsp:Transcript_15190/g.45584  ORF Transcript_15190/g.45584 Transcript_15190/m.45584 type:complete len:89 (-) Transcript_15190:340-606(-)
MLLSEEPDTIFVPSGEKLTEYTSLLWALVRSSSGASVAASHSCMLLSREPDTILVPSGEKPTEYTWLLWALGCSATSASVDASHTFTL